METISTRRPRAQRATYAELGDACATAHAMELIGNRWTYPILRELMLGPKRFNTLMASVRGITPAVLTARLRELEGSGLVEPAPAPEGNPLRSYALTPWALELAPILRALGRWAQSSPHRVPGGGLTPDAVVQAMITMAPERAPTPPVHVHLHLFDARSQRPTDAGYCIRWTAEQFHAERALCAGTATTVSCDSSTWGHVLFSGATLADSGAAVSGPMTPVRRLVQAFHRR